ncbi:unnamed protein product [Caenorhabditis nigoni]
MKVLIFLAFSICLVSAQQLIDLKTFRGENVQNPINAHAPYDVFVSATSDDAEVLAQIHLITDKQNQTFLQLKNRKPFLTTSQIQPFPVQTTAYVTTNLTDEQVKHLTGTIFICTTNQQQNDVDESSTNSTTTTGFYMKPKNQKDRNVTIQIAQNSNDVAGVTGSNTVGTFPKTGKVTFGVRSTDLEVRNPMHPRDEIQDWTTNVIGNQIFINSENGTDGEFFVQYYMRGQLNLRISKSENLKISKSRELTREPYK